METSSIKTFTVQTRFSLNLDDTAKSVSFNMAPGEVLQFDGIRVYVRGVTGIAPTMAAVIRLGWVKESSVAGTAEQPVVTAPAAPAPAPAALAMTAPTGRRSVSTEEYGKEMATSRMAALSASNNQNNTSTLVTSSTSAQPRRHPVSMEESPVRQTRTTVTPPPTVQYAQPATRPRREIVQHDAEEVQSQSRTAMRATSTQNSALLTGSDDTGATDAELGGRGKAASGRKSTISKGPVEKQELAGVVKTRRATPLNFGEQDMTKVSAAQASSDPAPINGDGAAIKARLRPTEASISSGGYITVTTSVSGEGTMSVPPAVSSSSDGIIMSKAASVAASDPLDIYDPANYLGLSAPAAAPVVDDVDFGEEDTLHQGRTLVDHEGNEVPVAHKGTTVLGDGGTDPKDEDYSDLNEGLEAGTAVVEALRDDEEVTEDFLTTLVVGGMPWQKSPHTAKIAYIKGKKVTGAKGEPEYRGGCNNKSLLRLILKQPGLIKSVLDAAQERLTFLGGKAPCKKGV